MTANLKNNFMLCFLAQKFVRRRQRLLGDSKLFVNTPYLMLKREIITIERITTMKQT